MTTGSAAHRDATADDARAIAALVERAYRSPRGEGWTTESHLVAGTRATPADVAAAIAAPDSLVAVGEVRGTIVSCCRLAAAGESVEFGMFGVEPTLQGRGYGSALLGWALVAARRRFGVHRVVLYVLSPRPELRRFYERRGFRATGARLPFAVVGATSLVEDLEFVEYAVELDADPR